jgi:hypothetical protein
MSRFLKITNYLLNTNDIHKIIITPNKYTILIVSKQLNGYNFNMFGMGFGNLFSYTSEIEICKTKHSIDYTIISNWLNSIKNEI